MSNGIHFGTDGWRATRDVFTLDRVRRVGVGIARYLQSESTNGTNIIVGYDAREDSQRIATDLGGVFVDEGFEVLVPDRDLPTPVIAYTILDRSLDGAVMITASHNPPEFNGIKFIPSNGAPAMPTVTDTIERSIPAESVDEPNPVPLTAAAPLLSAYERHLTTLIDTIDGDMRILYDAMHGSGRGVTDAILQSWGITVETIRDEQDPTFGGAAPEPIAANLERLLSRVSTGEFDLGIANDGDADRVTVVTPANGCIDGNELLAVLYDYLLETGLAGPVVRSVSTSSLVDRIAAGATEDVIETPVGFKWVAAELLDRNAVIGGEESGGYTIRGHTPEKDGVMTALLVVAANAVEPIDDRLTRIRSTYGPVVQRKQSVPCPDAKKQTVLATLIEILPNTIGGVPVRETSDLDGVKVFLDDNSWMLVRPSGTEPKLRIYAEASSVNRVEALLKEGTSLIEAVR